MERDSDMAGPRAESASTLLKNGTSSWWEDLPCRMCRTRGSRRPRSSTRSCDAGTGRVGTFDLTATLLPNGDVLVAGGLQQSGVTSSAELFDPEVENYPVSKSTAAFARA